MGVGYYCLAYFLVLSGCNMKYVTAFSYTTDLYETTPNPNLTSSFLDSADSEKNDCKNVRRCTLSCQEDLECQAALYNMTSQKCRLYHKGIQSTKSAVSNDLIYIQNACSYTTKNRPSYCPPMPEFKDCQEAYEYGMREPGVYKVHIDSFGQVDVWCNFHNRHGWTAFQRRQDGSVDFDKYWDDYKTGFGDINGEYWLGNDIIHEVTKTNQKLHMYLEAVDGTYRNAYYSSFYINDESDLYRMTLSSDNYTGNAEELFSYHNNIVFSTRDQDNDNDAGKHCAEFFKGGWWYNGCFAISLNGPYSADGTVPEEGVGICYCGGPNCAWKNTYSSLTKVVMELSRD